MKFVTIIGVVAFGLTRPVQGQTAFDMTTPSAPTVAVTPSASIPVAAQPATSQPVVVPPGALAPAHYCNPACASGQLCGANNQCMQLVPIAPPQVLEAPEAPLKPLPKVAVVLLPEASLTFGNDLFATAEVGLALQLRFQRLAVGLHVAKGAS